MEKERKNTQQVPGFIKRRICCLYNKLLLLITRRSISAADTKGLLAPVSACFLLRGPPVSQMQRVSEPTLSSLRDTYYLRN